MDHDITHYANARHTVKAYDSSRQISAEHIEQIKELLRLSPSSTNIQPWYFVLASTQEGKARVTNATKTLYPFNTNSILDSSLTVVFASRLDPDEAFLRKVLDQESADGRFDADPAFRDQMDAGRKMFMNIHKQDLKDVQHWLDKQVYLNMGAFLLGASALGIDATPMEGIDTKALDEEFGLREKGYASLAIVTLGYSDPKNDYNAKLPKSRLPYSEILCEV